MLYVFDWNSSLQIRCVLFSSINTLSQAEGRQPNTHTVKHKIKERKHFATLDHFNVVPNDVEIS